jgi:hypothetical protein
VAEVETKLVGKMDEKVVMTVEAEAETKLPVEEVVEAVEEMDKEVAEAAIANAETELEHTVDAKTGTISVAGDIADSNADDDIGELMEGINALGGSDVERAEHLEKKEPVLVVYPFVAGDLIEAVQEVYHLENTMCSGHRTTYYRCSKAMPMIRLITSPLLNMIWIWYNQEFM